MTLMTDIQDACASKGDVGDLLRKALILARRVKSAELEQWVKRELNGYEDKADVPDYRVVRPDSTGTFHGPFGARITNAPIPLSLVPEVVRRAVEVVHLSEPIATYATLAEETGEGQTVIRWRAEAIAYTNKESVIYPRMGLADAYMHIGRAQLVGMVDTVRTRLLEFALGLADVDPQAGEAGSKLPPAEQLTQIFNQTIYADQAVIGGGEIVAKNKNTTTNVTNSSNVQVAIGDRIKQALKNVPRDKEGKGEAEALEATAAAIEKDVKKEEDRKGALECVAGIAEQLANGAGRLALVVKALFDKLETILVAYPKLAPVVVALGVALGVG